MKLIFICFWSFLCNSKIVNTLRLVLNGKSRSHQEKVCSRDLEKPCIDLAVLSRLLKSGEGRVKALSSHFISFSKILLFFNVILSSPDLFFLFCFRTKQWQQSESLTEKSVAFESLLGHGLLALSSGFSLAARIHLRYSSV